MRRGLVDELADGGLEAGARAGVVAGVRIQVDAPALCGDQDVERIGDIGVAEEAGLVLVEPDTDLVLAGIRLRGGRDARAGNRERGGGDGRKPCSGSET